MTDRHWPKMQPLRFSLAWWIVGWLMVAAVCVGSLLPGPLVPTLVPSDKLEHAGAYFALTVWFCGMQNRRRHVPTAALLFALGFSLDWLQQFAVERSFDMLDVAANGSGILLGWLLCRSLLEGWCHRVERSFLA